MSQAIRGLVIMAMVPLAIIAPLASVLAGQSINPLTLNPPAFPPYTCMGTGGGNAGGLSVNGLIDCPAKTEASGAMMARGTIAMITRPRMACDISSLLHRCQLTAKMARIQG